jgi:hypothetical protein
MAGLVPAIHVYGVFQLTCAASHNGGVIAGLVPAIHERARQRQP